MENKEQTIVIRRIKKSGGGHHGGSWKIAFADFALALMAFFLVLWLIESTTELEKMVIAGYFSDPRSLANEGDGGTPYVVDLGGRPLSVANQGLNLALVQEDQEQFVEDSQELENRELIELARLRQIEMLQSLKGQVEEMVAGNNEFEWFNDALEIELTEEGLAIHITDRENRPIFDSGLEQLKPYARQVLWALAEILMDVPNKVSVYGHTDSVPYSTVTDEYTNWELSADRANSARRALVEGGMANERFSQIIGMGSSLPLLPEAPQDQANRRIVIMVLNEKIDEQLLEDVRNAEQRSTQLPSGVLPDEEPPEIFY